MKQSTGSNFFIASMAIKKFVKELITTNHKIMKKIILLSFIAINAMVSNAQTAYITNYGDNTVSVINVATNTVMATIAVGTSSFWCICKPRWK